MRRTALGWLGILLFCLTLTNEAAHGRATDTPLFVPTPESVLGFTPGDDRKLASWAQIVEYFQKLDAASDRVKFETIGQTTMGAPFVYATISAPENLAKLDYYKDIQRQLADPRTFRSNDAVAQRLIKQGKTIVLITCGIHSSEVGSYLSSTLIAHRLASANDAATQKILQETIILLVPSLNPDGVDIIKNWYDQTLGTPYEGTDPPMLYHKFTGHDNNRDWYAFTQVETQLTVDKLHNVWHPQIVHDIHQQGDTGARLFLPPYMKPVEPNVPRQLVKGYTDLGTYIAAQMRAEGYQGITNNSTYDAWTPARAYSHYHAGVRLLSETASARLASPRTITFEQLRADADEGYDPQKESDNFGPLWRGGEWHLRDITDTMTRVAFHLLDHAANNRSNWLTQFYQIGKEAVRPRKAGELFGYVILPDQPNAEKLIKILYRGGVEVDWARNVKPFTVKGVTYPAWTRIVPMAQPYGAFAKALLENQKYPDITDAEGHPIAPYDVTAHTLPLLMNVEAKAVTAPFTYPKPTNVRYESSKLGCEETKPAILSRTGIYQSYAATIDEGWTRWAFEAWKKQFLSVQDAEIRAGNLKAKFDTIIIPDQNPRQILEGYKPDTMPAEYTGGLGAEGVAALREFVAAGGTLVTFNHASEFALNALRLPVEDITTQWKRKEFYVPGSLLRLQLDTTHALAAGMPRDAVAWVEDSPVFAVAPDTPNVKVVAWYPADKDPLLSGWLLGGDKIKGRAALVEVTMEKGRVVLFGFRPQYRGQSLATYPLLFNALKR